jgi:hypothetical protein
MEVITTESHPSHPPTQNNKWARLDPAATPPPPPALRSNPARPASRTAAAHNSLNTPPALSQPKRPTGRRPTATPLTGPQPTGAPLTAPCLLSSHPGPNLPTPLPKKTGLPQSAIHRGVVPTTPTCSSTCGFGTRTTRCMFTSSKYRCRRIPRMWRHPVRHRKLPQLQTTTLGVQPSPFSSH